MLFRKKALPLHPNCKLIRRKESWQDQSKKPLFSTVRMPIALRICKLAEDERV